MDRRRTAGASVTIPLVAAGLVFATLYAGTSGGMGRNVGGAFVVTAFTWACLYAWPVAFFLASRPLAEDSRRSLRRFGYVSAPALYFGIAMWVPKGVLEGLGLEEIWFNYFGEAQIFTQGAKGVLYAAVTAAVLEALRRSLRKRRGSAQAA